MWGLPMEASPAICWTALPSYRVSQLVQPPNHALRAVESSLPEARERSLEIGVGRVYEVAENVNLRTRHVGA